MFLLVTPETEQVIQTFLEEMESLIDADDGVVFQIQHIDMIVEIKERLESSTNIERGKLGDYYEQI